jgi:hypothetical protein
MARTWTGRARTGGVDALHQATQGSLHVTPQLLEAHLGRARRHRDEVRTRHHGPIPLGKHRSDPAAHPVAVDGATDLAAHRIRDARSVSAGARVRRQCLGGHVHQADGTTRGAQPASAQGIEGGAIADATDWRRRLGS